MSYLTDTDCSWAETWAFSNVSFDLSTNTATLPFTLSHATSNADCEEGNENGTLTIPLAVSGSTVTGSLASGDYILTINGTVNGSSLPGTFTAALTNGYTGSDSGSFDLTTAGQIEITLDPMPPNNQYVIDAAPTMPNVRARAKVVGINPDPTTTTTFTWTVSLMLNSPSGPVDFSSDFVQNMTTVGTSLFTLTPNDATSFRGGQLTLTASATANGNALMGETPANLRISGTNPERSAIQQYINQQGLDNLLGLRASDTRDVLKRIACQESSQEQFVGAADGGVGHALVSSDGGVGLFQITNAPCDPFDDCPDIIFNWQANADAGSEAFSGKIRPASNFPSRMGASQQYEDFITGTINPQRLKAGLRPIPGAPAPSFSTSGLIGSKRPNQLLEDAVRGFNGYGGPRMFGLPLHEFVPDTTFLLHAANSQLPGIARNPLVWRRVLPGERQPTNGDASYVEHVSAQSPECGD